jgi:hypothetical protein
MPAHKQAAHKPLPPHKPAAPHKATPAHKPAAAVQKPLPPHKPTPARKPARRRSGLSTVLLALAAVGLSLMIAAWITNAEFPTLASAALPPNADRASFEDRFVRGLADRASLQPLKRSILAKAASEFSTAREALASRWPQEDLRPAIVADNEPEAPAVDPTPPTPASPAIPLPRSRPVAADQPALTSQALALATTMPVTTPTESLPARPPERSLMQKFSDMVKTRVTLTSLAVGKAPDLVALGYDNETAVYDITAHSVYLPNGTVFEAHSGMGSLRDDPDHVSVPNTGATPPATYSLKPRESIFHGVAALRMTPAEGSDISGRSGLLVHSYMLGPNGDSNGCISVRDFDRFRKAYDDGQFTHIAVVPSVKAIILAQQNAE